MGSAICSKLACYSIVDECARGLQARDEGKQSPNSFWCDCGGLGPRNLSIPVADTSETGQSVDADLSPGDAIAADCYAQATNEDGVRPTVEKFAICSAATSSTNDAQGLPNRKWRTTYTLGRELGAGQTAVVFEASSATGPHGDDHCANEEPLTSESACEGPSRQVSSGGRRVALKKFNVTGTTMFKQEIRALKAISVHPNIMRLLESFEGGDDADVLILEFCEGGDLYEIYAAYDGCCMPEDYVAQLIRQLLCALAHLVHCGVEHRDVKPENLLLYGPSNSESPCLKLADFGWAEIVNFTSKPSKIPPEGVGSLWYAPPELNPPVRGCEVLRKSPAGKTFGRSDMWSVGVITYLLLVGHSPFNIALQTSSKTLMEKEVIRLAAMGAVNFDTPSWPTLSPEARDFITSIIIPDASKRPLPAEALQHTFIIMNCTNSDFAEPLMLSVSEAERQWAWASMDGVQRLCWMAIARAVSEPELLEVRTSRKLTCHKYSPSSAGVGTGSYLEHLAAELVVVAVPTLFQSQTGWASIMYLAFLYLDIDRDGVIGEKDLRAHLGDMHQNLVEKWIVRFRRDQLQREQPGLGIFEFQGVLWSTLVRPIHCRTPSVPVADEDSCSFNNVLGLNGNEGGDLSLVGNDGQDQEKMLEYRMRAIEEICEQYIDQVLLPENTLVSVCDFPAVQ